MASTPIYRFVGQSYALSCGVTAAGPVTVTGATDTNTCAFWNTNTTAVAVSITNVTAVAIPPLTFPVPGAPSGAPSFILPPAMDIPTVVVVPSGGFNVFGVAQSTGAPAIQFVRCELQS